MEIHAFLQGKDLEKQRRRIPTSWKNGRVSVIFAPFLCFAALLFHQLSSFSVIFALLSLLKRGKSDLARFLLSANQLGFCKGKFQLHSLRSALHFWLSVTSARPLVCFHFALGVHVSF
jgi:hypothetical protein